MKCSLLVLQCIFIYIYDLVPKGVQMGSDFWLSIKSISNTLSCCCFVCAFMIGQYHSGNNMSSKSGTVGEILFFESEKRHEIWPLKTGNIFEDCNVQLYLNVYRRYGGDLVKFSSYMMIFILVHAKSFKSIVMLAYRVSFCCCWSKVCSDAFVNLFSPSFLQHGCVLKS